MSGKRGGTINYIASKSEKYTFRQSFAHISGRGTVVANVYAGWIAILVGVVAGLAAGLFFHDEKFLGGYTSWSRRLTRLGHVSFFGLGFVNLGMGLTSQVMSLTTGMEYSSWLLILGLITMPTVCYVSAFWKPFRHLFFIPVLSSGSGVAIFVWRLLGI